MVYKIKFWKSHDQFKGDYLISNTQLYYNIKIDIKSKYITCFGKRLTSTQATFDTPKQRSGVICCLLDSNELK